jgi:hypothetical protein
MVRTSCRFEESLAQELIECGVDLIGCLLLRVVPGRYDDVLHDIGRIQGPGLPRVKILLDVAFVPL